METVILIAGISWLMRSTALQHEAPSLRFQILTILQRFVTRTFSVGTSIFTFIVIPALAIPAIAAPLWETGDDTAGPGSFSSSEPPAGPPVWERASPLDMPEVTYSSGPTPKQPVWITPAVAPPPAPTPAAKAAPVEPVVAQDGKVQLPTADKIAAELGYKQSEFKKYVEEFASSISLGPHSNAFRRLCARDENACRLLADFHAQASNAKRERRKVRHKGKRFRITEENVAQAQRFDFPVLANSLKVASVDQLTALSAKSFEEKDCPRNLSAALAIKAEEYFPDAQARKLAHQLFEHSRPCLQATDEIYERLHLRWALYALYEGDKARAKELLLAANNSSNSTEKYRVLYWLGRIAVDGQPKENEYWTALMNQFPLSYYAIDAAVKLNKDPMQMITQRKVGGLKRESADDPELNRMVRWLEGLYVYKQSNAVAKWASWIVRANEGELDVDVLLYLSSLKIASGLYRSNIQMLFGYFRKNPTALNTEGLKLLYPRPYYDMISEATKGKIDTFLVMALVRQESGFDARAVSRVKAKGLMQIMPGTARRIASQGHRKLLDEKENTKMGVKYLLTLSEEFGGTVELVLAGYNAGPHKVDEWLRRNPDRKADPLLWNDLIPYMETRDYVVSILRNNYLYLRLYGSSSDKSQEKLFSSELVRELLAKSATASK